MNTLIGRRVRLIRTNDPYTNLESGALGLVSFVDCLGTVFVDWDNGSSLGLIRGEDSWEYLHPDDCFLE